MATLNILSTLDIKFSVADILCKVMPAVEPYLKERLIKLRNKVHFHSIIISTKTSKFNSVNYSVFVV